MFRTLNDLKGKEEKKGDKKKNTESYAGGEKSGLAVESGNDEIDAIVQKAQQNSRARAEGGAKGDPPKNELKITLFQNGFTIDDGQFRDYTAPENQEFMKELNEGYVPKEIQDKYKNKGGVGVALEDKRKEKYRPPTPPKYVAYSGQGTNLGGTSGTGLQVNKDAAGKPIVDESQPKTTIQIRFHNGERASITLNLTHRVNDIHEYVMLAAPVDGEYQLVSGFPPKALTDPMKTIQEAGLKGASITQKII